MRHAPRNISTLLLAALLYSSIAPGTAEAQRAIRGVECGGGFFVRGPDGRIFWIHGDPERKTEVHGGRERLVAVAECGTGVVSVFATSGEPALSRVLFSADCQNLSTAAVETSLLYEGSDTVSRLSVEEEGIVLGFASGESNHSNACSRRDIGIAND